MSFKTESTIRAGIGLLFLLIGGSYWYWGPGLFVPGLIGLLILATILFVLGVVGMVIARKEEKLNDLDQ